MTRKYETMFILNPSLTDEEQTAQVEAIRAVLTKHQAVIKAEHKMGVKNLAYAINKFDRGYYHVIYFEAPTAAINFLEKFYKVTESVFRFIVVKYENKSEVKAWETMVKKALGEKVEEKMIKTRERNNYKKIGDRNTNNRSTPSQTDEAKDDSKTTASSEDNSKASQEADTTPDSDKND